MDGIIIAVIGAIVSIASIIALVLKSRGENKNAATSAKTALDSLIDARVTKQLETAWLRIDEVEGKFQALELRETRRTGAITRILRAIASQWPGPQGPDLDPADIAEIEETIPVSWIRKGTRR